MKVNKIIMIIVRVNAPRNLYYTHIYVYILYCCVYMDPVVQNINKFDELYTIFRYTFSYLGRTLLVLDRETSHRVFLK